MSRPSLNELASYSLVYAPEGVCAYCGSKSDKLVMDFTPSRKVVTITTYVGTKYVAKVCSTCYSKVYVENKDNSGQMSLQQKVELCGSHDVPAHNYRSDVFRKVFVQSFKGHLIIPEKLLWVEDAGKWYLESIGRMYDTSEVYLLQAVMTMCAYGSPNDAILWTSKLVEPYLDHPIDYYEPMWRA